ncbi:MAG: hypothetical protein QM528_01640 [Phycisphaerales bacterium]|nr:hypothetical protein [Phycisphaerales bacterium]
MHKNITCLLIGALLIISLKGFAQLTYQNLFVDYTHATSIRKLTIIPIICTKVDQDLNQLSMVKAWTITHNGTKEYEQSNVSIVELSSTPLDIPAEVNQVSISNKTNEFVFLQSGTIIKGGKQDRILAQSILLAPNELNNIFPVYCIEKARWSKTPLPFHLKGVADMLIRRDADELHNQHEVWKTIDQYYKDYQLTNPTYSYWLPYHKVLDIVHIEEDQKDFLQLQGKMNPLTVGFIAITSDRIIGVDIYATPTLFNLMCPNILESYIKSVSEFDTESCLNKEVIETYCNRLLRDTVTQNKFLKKYGKLYTYQGRPLHIISFGY